MKRKGIMILVCFLLIIMSSGCQRRREFAGAEDCRGGKVDEQTLRILSTKSIYFGHQSVGLNIVEGIEELLRTTEHALFATKETRVYLDLKPGVFAHSKVGVNHDPIAKIHDFRSFIDSGAGEVLDIAFFKFCYVDIVEDTDINKVFSEYSSTMDYLSQKYPRVKFVHFTVPLTVSSQGIKARIKRLLGLGVWGDKDNLKREQFNRLLRNQYADSGRIFDLAAYESTLSDGRRNVINGANGVFYGLFSCYSSDAGHLNLSFSKTVANKLLVFLGSL
ncbi:MAG: hypothetical protein A4E56_01823 [Pelotomaculum sp. PtaU1.Bin065]|nr:MAG: hypothetical protein A4E56_01823 [Pelotomaculum sp. PtaU1.Bin065]